MVNIEEVSALAKNIKRSNDWPVVLLHLHVQAFSILALWYMKDTFIATVLFALLLVGLSYIGTTAGAHRLWTHRSYTADLKLRIFLMLCQTLVGEGTIYNWVLEHRLHHKHFGTNLDPFNINKRFFDVHLMSKMKKITDGLHQVRAEVDMSDIENDSVVMFQKKYYWALFLIVTVLLPINAPAEYWGESLYFSGFVVGILRIALALNLSWLVSSSIKIWSLKSGQNDLRTQNLLELIEKQEWLPYHYMAPWDYRTSEYGGYGNDLASIFINICKLLGMASNLKTMDGPTIGKAIQMSALNHKPISECLSEIQNFEIGNPQASN